MKRINVFLLAMTLACVVTNAQEDWFGLNSTSYFNEDGTVADKAAVMNVISQISEKPHRADDVVWAKIVYRIVDLRFKQNYQLYTPVVADDPNYSSLFRTMLRAIEGGMPVYQKSNQSGDIKPYFDVSNKVHPRNIPGLLGQHLKIEEQGRTPQQVEEERALQTVLNYVDKDNDPTTNDSILQFNAYPYETSYSKNVVKYLRVQTRKLKL